MTCEAENPQLSSKHLISPSDLCRFMRISVNVDVSAFVTVFKLSFVLSRVLILLSVSCIDAVVLVILVDNINEVN